MLYSHVKGQSDLTYLWDLKSLYVPHLCSAVAGRFCAWQKVNRREGVDHLEEWLYNKLDNHPTVVPTTNGSLILTL